MGKIFLDIEAINSGNWFNVKKMINAINDLLKSYGVNGAACVRLPIKPEFANGVVLVGKIFAGKEEYTFPFYKTGDAAVFLKDTGMSPATTIAKGNHLEILFEFFDLVGSKLRVNIKRDKRANGILCEKSHRKEKQEEELTRQQLTALGHYQE